jgi:hypothetical protein
MARQCQRTRGNVGRAGGTLGGSVGGLSEGVSTTLASCHLYGFLAWSLLHSLRSRQALYLIFAPAPFACWALAVAGSHAKAEAERDRAGVVALPVPAELPDTIVFEGKANFPRPADIRTFFGFRYAIYVRRAGKRASSDTICATGTPASRNWWRRCPRAAWSFRANAATSYWRDGESQGGRRWAL